MKHNFLISFVCILFWPCPAILAQQVEITEAEMRIKQDITDEDIREFARQREEHKDDPKTMELLDSIQEAAGITEADIARAQGKPVADADRPSINADPNVAEQAYRSGDYETALKHYQPLAAEGDAYANLILGLMYQQGQGVDADMSKAYAYYERASEHGDDRGSELIETIEMEMSEEEIRRADQYSSELAEQRKQNSEM